MPAHFLPRHSARRIASMLMAALTLYSSPATVWAWGSEGHRVTGLVANELLTPKARIRLNQLVPGINLGEFTSQMDVFRAALAIELPGSDKWHYDNPAICGNRPYADYCANGNCASSKIEEYSKILADSNATTEARAQAAMFLVHMVGDIHQPLHSSSADMDLGGNYKNVLIPGTDVPRNLHRVWDSDLPKLALRGISESDFAKQLAQRYKAEMAAWQQGDARAWVNESLAISQKVTYGNLPEFSCGTPWPKEKVVALPQSYMDAGQQIIPEQLAKAGARIAWMLNRALENGPDPVAAKPVVEYAKVNRGTIASYVMLIRLRYDLYGKWKANGKWPDDAEANKALAAHSAYWQDQLKAGRALFAGGMKGEYWDNMALIVFEAGSQQEADALVAADPAVKAFVFQAQARPFDVQFISNKYSAADKKP